MELFKHNRKTITKLRTKRNNAITIKAYLRHNKKQKKHQKQHKPIKNNFKNYPEQKTTNITNL